MRVTFLLPVFPRTPGGGARVVYEYANHLVGAGHQATVVHSLNSHGGAGFSRERAHAFLQASRVLVRDGPRWRGVTWMRLDRRVRMVSVPRLEPDTVPEGDVLVATFWATTDCLMACPPSKGMKMQLIQGWEAWAGPEHEVIASWLRPVPKVVVSAWLFAKGVELGVEPTRMRHIPNAVDHDAYRVLTPLAERPRRIAMLFHKDPVKGGADGLRALELVHSRRPDVAVTLFGLARKPPALPSWIDYRHRPQQEEMVRDVYNASSIYLSPSTSEGWGLTAAEAMACGCAVVSTRNGGIDDFGRDGANVLLAPVGDPEGMARLVLGLLDDDGRRIALAGQGREDIRAFRWSDSTAAFTAWVDELRRA